VLFPETLPASGVFGPALLEFSMRGKETSEAQALSSIVNFLNRNSIAISQAGSKSRPHRKSRRSSDIGSTPTRNWSQANANGALAEMKADLERLVNAGGSEKTTRLALVRIVERVNAIGLRRVWAVSHNSSGRKPICVMVPKSPRLKNPPEELCGLILVSLLDGSLLSLRKCKRCKRFFGRGQKNRLFCGSTCLKAFYDADALTRVRKSRQIRREKRRLEPSTTKAAGNQAKSLNRNGETMMIEAFEEFLERSGDSHPEQDEEWSSHFSKLPGSNSERWQLLNHWLSDRKKGVAAKTIWCQTPQRFRHAWITNYET
jgi:hypothetical protein